MNTLAKIKMNREEIVNWFKALQDEICSGLEKLDGSAQFRQDLWQRSGGGGGRTRIITGKQIEKGGVNFSEVFGEMPSTIAQKLDIPPGKFLATGISIVLHPNNPWVPIIHMNIRYFEMNRDIWWFGGGIDVTPHYIVQGDAIYFHKKLQSVCDGLYTDAYKDYKKWADDYFFITHREETRGIGGIFFDRLGDRKAFDKKPSWNFVQSVGSSFLEIYTHLFRENHKKPFDEQHKKWQKVRRGRYVEFNLVYDRGTKFGLETSGRTESILMSLPPEANWTYDHVPLAESLEGQTQALLKKGIDWVNYREE